MADQRLITLRPGDVNPKDIVLRELPVADAAATTTIYLYAGNGTPKDVVLRDPTVLQTTSGSYTSEANPGVVNLVGSSTSNLRTYISTTTVGTVTLSGFTATSTKQIISQTSVGQIVCTGFNTTALYNRVSSTATASIQVIGFSTTNTKALISSTAVASINVTGLAATALRALISNTAVSSIVLAGYAATSFETPVGSYTSDAVPGTISLTGFAATSTASGASDPRLDQILAILLGKKVYNAVTKLWRVYDENGIELADPSGILLRGLHGWLLQKANESIPSEIWYDIAKHILYTNLDEFKQINNQDLYLYDNQLVKKLSTIHVMTL